MWELSNSKLTNLLTALGILLSSVSVLLMVVSTVSGNRRASDARQIAGELRAVMPNVVSGFPEERTDNSMPVLSLHGESFIGTVEIPVYGTFLPVRSTWDNLKITYYPCRYTGSVYDGSLVIGGSDGEGQFDFMKLITGGDLIYITEMTGVRYCYTVADIQRSKDVSTAALSEGDYDLVLFARNTYAFDYTIVRCVINGKN